MFFKSLIFFRDETLTNELYLSKNAYSSEKRRVAVFKKKNAQTHAHLIIAQVI